MGNRCYIARAEKENDTIKIKYYYMHWYGSLDFINPLLSIAENYNFSFEKLHKHSSSAYECQEIVLNNKQDYINFILSTRTDNGIYFINKKNELVYRANCSLDDINEYDFDKLIKEYQEDLKLEPKKIKNKNSKRFDKQDIEEIKNYFKDEWKQISIGLETTTEYSSYKTSYIKAYTNAINELFENSFNSKKKVYSSQKLRIMPNLNNNIPYTAKDCIDFTWGLGYPVLKYIYLDILPFEEFKQLF